MKIRMIIDKGGVGQTEVQDLLFEQEWEISQKRFELPTAVFVLDGRPKTSPLRDLEMAGKDIVVEDFADANTRLFGGIVVRVARTQAGLGSIFTLECMGFAFRLHRKVTTGRYVLTTAKAIIQDVFERAGLSGASGSPAGGEGFDANTFVSTGWTIRSMQFVEEDVSRILSILAEISGVSYWIDSFKRLHFREPELEFTNVVLADTNIDNITRFAGADLTNIIDITSLVNVVRVFGGLFRQKNETRVFAGDGVTTEFSAKFQWAEYEDAGQTKRIEIRVYETGLGGFGAPLSVGLAGSEKDRRNLAGAGGDDSIDVLWDVLARTLEFAAAPLNRTDAFQVRGDIAHRVIAVHRDFASIARFGPWEHVIKDTRITDQAAAELRAQSELRELAAAGDLWTFSSIATGVVNLEPGQVMTIDSQGFNRNARNVVHSNTIRLLGGEVFQASLDVRRIPTPFIGPVLE